MEVVKMIRPWPFEVAARAARERFARPMPFRVPVVRRRRWLTSTASAAVLALALVATGPVASATTAAYPAKVVLSGTLAPLALTFDSSGDLFIANDAGTLTVVPKTTGTIFGQSVTANTAAILRAFTGVAYATGLTFDAAGDLFLVDLNNDRIAVIAKTSGTLFGQKVTANKLVTLAATSGQLGSPWGISVGPHGDLFVTNYFSNTITILPKVSGTIFGQSVTANTATTLTAGTDLSNPRGLAFDAAGDLFVSNIGNGSVTLIPEATDSVFGQSVTANTAATLSAPNDLETPYGMLVDTSGDLLIASSANSVVEIIPRATGTVFGQSVTANTAATLTADSGVNGPFGLAQSVAGDLFIANSENTASEVEVVAKASGTVFGQRVTANHSATLQASSIVAGPNGLVVNAAGDLFVADYFSDEVTVLPATTGKLFGQTFTAGVPAILQAATGLDAPHGLAFDSRGDLFIANSLDDVVTVVPKTSGTIFGQSVAANVATALSAAVGLNSPHGLAFDPAGDLFIASTGTDTVTVIPRSTGSLFGQSVTANQAASLSAAYGLENPNSVALDAAGDLFITNAGGQDVTVVAKTTRTVFGQSVTADTAATLRALPLGSDAHGLAFNAAGDLFVADDDAGVVALTPVTGAILGQSVSSYAATTLRALPNLVDAEGITFAPSGALYVSDEYGVTVYEIAVTPGAPSAVVASAGKGDATVHFKAPANGGAAITRYTVTASPGARTCVTSTTSCTVTGLAKGARYAFTVAATNAVGTGPASAPSSRVKVT
jgi:sugar lactone lactonase YvrE